MTDASSSSRSRLTVLTGPMAGKELVLEETVDNVLIGSDPSCRFHVPGPGVSPIHARLWMDASGVTVYDTNSARGLYVNDDRVSRFHLKIQEDDGQVLHLRVFLDLSADREAVETAGRRRPRRSRPDYAAAG